MGGGNDSFIITHKFKKVVWLPYKSANDTGSEHQWKSDIYKHYKVNNIRVQLLNITTPFDKDFDHRQTASCQVALVRKKNKTDACIQHIFCFFALLDNFSNFLVVDRQNSSQMHAGWTCMKYECRKFNITKNKI